MSKIENSLKVWRMRHSTLEGKINFFEISCYFKDYVHLALVTPISTDINHLNTIQKKRSLEK